MIIRWCCILFSSENPKEHLQIGFCKLGFAFLCLLVVTFILSERLMVELTALIYISD